MYDFAVNKDKLNRAIKSLKDDKKPVTEEAVKELYVSYGGLLAADAPKATKKATKN